MIVDWRSLRMHSYLPYAFSYTRQYRHSPSERSRRNCLIVSGKIKFSASLRFLHLRSGVSEGTFAQTALHSDAAHANSLGFYVCCRHVVLPSRGCGPNNLIDARKINIY